VKERTKTAEIRNGCGIWDGNFPMAAEISGGNEHYWAMATGERGIVQEPAGDELMIDGRNRSPAPPCFGRTLEIEPGRHDNGGVLVRQMESTQFEGRYGPMPTTRILVVDDEPIIVRLASTVLEQEGYEVFTALTPRDALAAADDGRRIDLVLSDFIMPEMNGLELVRKFRERSPGTACLLMSGYLANHSEVEMPVVRKPFSANELLSMVRQALERSERSSDGQR
jgi:CheY-like chemotaxis protein